MALDFSAPYALDGSVIPGAGLRRGLQYSAGAGSGIARPEDLQIVPLDTPGAGFKVRAGDDLIQNRTPGANRETYGISLFTDQNYLGDDGLGVPGTGSTVPAGGRRDMVIHEVLDPQAPKHFTPQELWPEGQSSKISIVQNVGQTARRVSDVPALADVTAYELGAILYPANTSTIGLGMIEDLRRLQQPHTPERALRPIDLTEVQRLANPAGTYPTGGTTFPSEFSVADRMLAIPDWATHARIVMQWGSVFMPNNTTAKGTYWVQIGTNAHPDVVRTPQGSFDALGSGGRETWVKGATVKIPKSMRGTRQSFLPRALLAAALAENLRPYLNTTSSIILDVEFFEDVVTGA